ncbi:hypothetical protein [Rhizobium sp. PL01]|uniref:hypothetical protein n=1 Tax=Rhizobium sp. PL01 TaxID=3085631 RepID=UPI00298180A5|nr:hypothetical protein [Rhizobium sp. PL01]MDW5314536.1 hypothetical protein [Rhizobium sp. PL01]
MLLVFVALISGAGYAFFRFNVKTGTETVRAFIFLRGLANGERPSPLVNMSPLNVPTSVITAAKDFVDTFFKGRQLPFIGVAYIKGLQSNMPGWYRRCAIKAALEFHEPITLAQVEADLQSKVDFDEAEYARYYTEFLKELKRLSGKSDTDLHWVELADDEGQRLAFIDRVNPLTLAQWYKDQATPPLSSEL